MDDYIVKPVEVARLREALLRAAGELSQAAEPAPQSRESSSATCEWIDAAVLDSLGDRSIPVEAAGLAELIDLYIADAALLMGRIESGIAAGAHDEVRLTSHTLKGSSTNLGARRLAAVAGEIEAAAKSAEHSKERELLPELRTDWESTRRALEEVVSGMRPK